MQTPEQLSAELHNASVPNWEGELARRAGEGGHPEHVLDIGCETGKVARQSEKTIVWGCCCIEVRVIV